MLTQAIMASLMGHGNKQEELFYFVVGCKVKKERVHEVEGGGMGGQWGGERKRKLGGWMQ